MTKAMKNIFFLKKCLLVTIMAWCLGHCVSSQAETTYKLVEVRLVADGSLYVFEQDGYVMNNTVSSSALQTTKSFKTTGLTGTETYVWKLESATGGFYMGNCSLSSNKYLNSKKNETGLSFGSKSSIWKFTFTDGVALIQDTKNDNRFLGYSKSNPYEYKAYSEGSLGSYLHAVKVYRLDEVAYTVTAQSNNVDWGTVAVSGNIITATPTAGHRVSTDDPWEVTSGTATVAQSGNVFTVTTEADCTVRINFEAIPVHTATFWVDGVTVGSDSFAEGTAVTFPGDPADVLGKSFVGWTTEAIDGATDEAPLLLSSTVMGTADQTFYAVFAQVEEEGVTATFDASDLSNLQASASHATGWVDKETGIELWVSSGARYTSGNPYYFMVAPGTSNYLEIDAGGPLTSIMLTTDGAAYGMGNTSAGVLTADGLTQTVTLTGDVRTLKCYATASEQIHATKVVVSALLRSCSDYCTTVTTTCSATITAAAQYAAFSSPRAVDFSGTAVTVYAARFDGSRIVLGTVADGIVPAQTGVILYKDVDTDETVEAAVTQTDKTSLENNDLLVSDGSVVGDGATVFALSKKNQGVGFYRVKSGVAVPDGKPYLQIETAGAREFLGFYDETTGVSLRESASRASASPVYTLGGRTVVKSRKGVSVVNGRKVIIK